MNKYKNKTYQDKWGKMIYSVKTGNQCKPEFIRELLGAMKIHNAQMGVLILDRDPSQQMEILAMNQGQISCLMKEDLPEVFFDKIQIITAQEIIDGMQLDMPPTTREIKLHRESRQRNFGSLC